MRRAARYAAALLLVVALVAGVPAAASAAPRTDAAASIQPAADDFTPSKGKWRKYMINVMSSVLGAATPRGWKAEQIANDYAFNFGAWDDLNARLGIDGVRTDSNGKITGVKYSNKGQGTYTDVVIDRMEAEYNKTAKKGGKGGKPHAAPATKPAKFAKTVAGAAVAYTAFEVGTMLGAVGVDVVGGFFGFDANDAVCSQTADGSFLSDAQRFLSGQDCAMWEFDNEYVPNADLPPIWSASTYGGGSVKYLGQYVPQGGSTNNTYNCYSWTPPTGWNINGFVGTGNDQVALHYKRTDGTWRSITAPNSTKDFVNPQPNWIGYHCIPNNFLVASALTGGIGDPLLVFRYTNRTGKPAAGQEPQQGTDDPERQAECVVSYTDGSFLSSTGAKYKESTGAMAMPACPATPDGKVPDNVKINEKVGGTSKEVGSQPVTPEYKDSRTKYPECDSGACRLDLYKKVTGAKFAVSCFDLEDGCAGWFEDENKADNYTCRYGVHKVALKECNVYAELFAPGKVESGAAYVDPETGTWSGGQTSDKSGQGAFSERIQDPAKIRGCDLSGMGFDPIGWVMRPVQCAMEWAFVPRPMVVDVAFYQGNAKWAQKPPAVIAAAVSNVSVTAPGNGCSIPINFMGTSANIVDVCSGPLSALPVFSRLLVSAFIVIIAFNLIRRQIAGGVGYNTGQG